MSEPARKSSTGKPLFLPVLAKVWLDDSSILLFGFSRGASHIFLHVLVTLTTGARLKSQHPAMFRLSTLGNLWSGHFCVARSSTRQPA
ncbi:hypothetical protein PS918_04631 [Pseudomonas fluorescens]|uniref:Uncharacterized protein n=1 Tax=Pseudomonas fluorescens TaxID=294 RepID=A0A5E7U5G8_PSEFL|nr:hypothetical protein PS918_04631 [Pseudomonas fluorescens]